MLDLKLMRRNAADWKGVGADNVAEYWNSLCDDIEKLLTALEKIDIGCDCAPYTTCSTQGEFRCRSCIAREALAAVGR